MKRTNIMEKKLIERYIAGDATQAEKEAVQLWIEADDGNYREYMELRKIYNITLAVSGDISDVPYKNVALREFLKIAAAVAITFACTYFIIHNRQGEAPALLQTLHAPAGQRAELRLADGTYVWLNSMSTLIFPDRFADGVREVSLEGEAYFDVRHNAQKPFTVHAKQYDVNVTGTEFNVLSYDSLVSRFEISLLKGEVEISRRHGESIRLLPGFCVYEDGDKLVTSRIEDYNHFLWKKGIISFNNEPVEDILNTLQRYYDVEIKNNNLKIKDMRYTGKFRTKDGIEHVLNVLRIATGLKYIKDADRNVITVY